MRAICKYTSIEEIVDDNMNKEKYKKVVNPLSYDFCLNKNEQYYILGIINFSDILKVYIFSDKSDSCEIEIKPMILFECSKENIPVDWKISFGTKDVEHFEILPERLACIKGWFERYIDDDPEVINIVKEEVRKLRSYRET